METPILNDKHWAKVPYIPADAFLVDLEDSVPDNAKVAARERAIEFIGRPEYFHGRPIISRCNNLRTPWGRDDLLALGHAKAPLICYPKIETAAELYEAAKIVASTGHTAQFDVMIETARGLFNLEEICEVEGVIGLHFGYIDFAAEANFPAYVDGEFNWPGYYYPSMKIALAAAAWGCFCTSGTLVPDLRNADVVRAWARRWVGFGYTGFICVLPDHIPVVNELMSPTPEEVSDAEELCAAYDAAAEAGDPATYFRGALVTAPDYRLALRIIERHKIGQGREGGKG
jgi:citrate lyase beta subunit